MDRPGMFDFSQQCWFLTGPTASGKTSVGIALARRLGAEIISLDSMAVYRGMDIGTAKPTVGQRAAIRHHLIDVVEPSEEYSLAQYLEAAERCVLEIRARNHAPLFVGGTPLYLKGLLRGIFEGPPADAKLRRELQEEASRQGPGYLHQRLAAVDPAAAARLHSNDARRLIRALEVYLKTGQPISAMQSQFDRGRAADACRVFVLDWPRASLNARIDRRVDAMFAEGLVNEVRGLAARPNALGKTAGQAVGYREVLDHLAGSFDLAATIALVKTHTRQFAKRQGVWFRSLSECRVVAVDAAGDSDIDPDAVATRVEQLG
jgi:tRNA dimethylallyltransferase